MNGKRELTVDEEREREMSNQVGNKKGGAELLFYYVHNEWKV